MAKRGGNIVLNSYDDLFETQQSKEDAGKEKVDMDKVTIKPDVLKKYFPKSYTPKQMEDTIIKLLEQWQQKQKNKQQSL